MRPIVTKLALAAVATVVLLGCGSSGTKTIVVETTTTPTATAPVTTYKMPVSATPTTCTVYLSGADALIEWASASFNVMPACQNWISLNAKQGELWTEQIPAGLAADDTQVCLLANSGGSVTASVLDDGDQVNGKGACEGLISAGWFEQNTSPNPVSKARPAPGSPKLVVTGLAGSDRSRASNRPSSTSAATAATSSTTLCGRRGRLRRPSAKASATS